MAIVIIRRARVQGDGVFNRDHRRAIPPALMKHEPQKMRRISVIGLIPQYHAIRRFSVAQAPRAMRRNSMF